MLQEQIEEKNKEVAKKISLACAEANRVLSNALSYAIVAGLMMIERKEDCPHGEFGPWLEKYCPEIQWRTATRFMNASRSAVAAVLGKAAADQIGHDVQFDGAPLYQILAADPSTLSKEARDVQNQFKDFLQGKTQHQLLLDWKEIKDKDKQTPRQQPTADDVTADRARQADEALNGIMASIDLFVLSGATLQHASDRVVQALLEKGIEMNARLRELEVKTKSTKPKGRAAHASVISNRWENARA